METKKRNTWIGVTVLSLAFVIIVLPLIVGYMSKRPPVHAQKDYLIKVKGIVRLSTHGGVLYLAGDNGKLYGLVGEKQKELASYINRSLYVFGRITSIGKGVIDNYPVRMVVDVKQYGGDEVGKPMSPAQLDALRIKIDKKRTLQQTVLTKLKKQQIYDVVAGKIAIETREPVPNEKTKYVILNDDFGDKYILVGALDTKMDLQNKQVTCLGRTTMPYVGYPTGPNEVTFEVSELYTKDLTPLMTAPATKK